MNLYAYVGNNPSAFIDPFGLSKCSDLRKAIRTEWQDIQAKVRDWFSNDPRKAFDPTGGHDLSLNQKIGSQRPNGSYSGLKGKILDYKAQCKKNDDDDDDDDFTKFNTSELPQIEEDLNNLPHFEPKLPVLYPQLPPIRVPQVPTSAKAMTAVGAGALIGAILIEIFKDAGVGAAAAVAFD